MPAVFSYETISNFYYEICSLYSCLLFNPDSLLINSTKKMKNLIDMIDQLCFTTSNPEDSSHSILIRLKFLNRLLSDKRLFDICNKNLTNFQVKLVSFLVLAYLNNTNPNQQSEFNAQKTTSSSAELELNAYLKNSIDKVAIFAELNLNTNSSVENFLVDFINRYANRLKEMQSMGDKKVHLDNFALYFQDLLRLINSLNTISSHAVIYKCYLIASQIIFSLSTFLHSRVSQI